MKDYIKKIIQNLAIFLLMLIGIKNLVVALPLKYLNPHNQFFSSAIDRNSAVFHHLLSFFIGVLMLLLAYRLYKRIRIAWIIEVIGLSGSLMLHVVRHQSISLQFAFIEMFVLVVLLLSYKDFGRHTDRITVKKALMFVAASFFLVIINATVGLLIMKFHIQNIHDILDAISSSVSLLIFMDTSVLTIKGKAGAIYADSLIAINWVCIISSAIFILKPLVYSPIVSKYDKDKVRNLVMLSGQNPMAYLALENDKKYFFGREVNGVCAYTIAADIFVVCGDMICSREDGFMFLSEILAFCKQNGYGILLLNTTGYFTDIYKMAGFGVVKYGEDACFKLEEYNLNGGKVAKVRAAINHANNAGITVHEYKPLEARDIEVEREIDEITKEWLINKGGEELKFMLGGTGLSAPMDRRYFYAVDASGRMLGYVVFLPYLSAKGYLADVTRRRNDAPQGVLEKIIYDAFMLMKDEGVIWGNMGLSPLYKVAESDRVALTERLFSYVYENMNNSYDFKALHHAKSKYAPTDWQPRYLAYYPKPFSLNYGYAILKVQMPNKIMKTVLSSIKRKE